MKSLSFLDTLCIFALSFCCVLSLAHTSSNYTVVNTPCDSISTVSKESVSKEKQVSNDTIDTHEDEFDGWYNVRSSIVSILTIVASSVSIFGIGSIWWSIKRKKITRNCQKRIILDLIRHFIVNASIVDGVKYKFKEDSMRPEEGVFARLATLDSDMNLERFEINSKNYEKIHNLSLSMRNYNLYVNMVEEHFKQNCNISTQNELYKELENINERLCDIVSKLWYMQNNIMKHRISFEEIFAYVTEKYGDQAGNIDENTISGLNQTQIPLLKEMKKDSKDTDVYKEYEKFYKKYVFYKLTKLSFTSISDN